MSGFGTLGKIIAKGGGDAIRKILPKTSKDYYDQFDPQTYYHATMEDIYVFNPRKINQMDLYDENPKPRVVTYFSSSPEYVNEYLDEYFDITNPNQYETGARIYPVKIKTKDLIQDLTPNIPFLPGSYSTQRIDTARKGDESAYITKETEIGALFRALGFKVETKSIDKLQALKAGELRRKLNAAR